MAALNLKLESELRTLIHIIFIVINNSKKLIIHTSWEQNKVLLGREEQRR
jgi:hypothetical protein